MSSPKLSADELLKKGDIIEVTSVGMICGLDEHEYCIRDRCEYWDKENRRCNRFVWVSVMFEGIYHTLIMRRETAKEDEKISRYLK